MACGSALFRSPFLGNLKGKAEEFDGSVHVRRLPPIEISKSGKQIAPLRRIFYCIPIGRTRILGILREAQKQARSYEITAHLAIAAGRLIGQ